MSRPLVAPSLIAADFSNLRAELEWLNESEADMLHIDVADGHFVPNILIGFPALKAIAAHTRLPLDFHLMMQSPEDYLERYVALGAASITVHAEIEGVAGVLERIRALGCLAGAAIVPETPVEVLRPIAGLLDSVLILSVSPGDSGGKFLPACVEKIQQTRVLLRSIQSEAKIVSDGGVCADNAQQIVEAGADILVMGWYIFQSSDKKRAISAVKSLSFAAE